MAGECPAPAPASDAAASDEISRENLALRKLVAVYRHLSGLALQNADIATVSQLIARHTNATVAVVSPTMDILAAAAPGETAGRAAQYVQDVVVHPRLAEVLSAASRARRALRFPDAGTAGSVIVAPVLVGDDVPAYLMTLDSAERPGEDTRLLLTEHAATICGVILGRETVVAAAASRVRDDLVEGLLSGRGQDAAEIGRWARHLGYHPDGDHHVLSVVVSAAKAGGDEADADAQLQRGVSAAEHFLSTRAPDAIISMRDDEVVIVLPEPAGGGPSRAARLGSMCAGRLGELLPEIVVTIGIGGSCREPAGIARSYAQARRTVQTLCRMERPGRVVAFEDLGIHRLLLQVPNLAELRGFAREVLGKLSLHEREHSSAYLATLGCYFRENSSPQRAARVLHVHPNTVTYRIRRVQEITGLDLDSHRDRLMAQVALEILDAVGDGL
ncbi:MAG TPA: helix-turn-helix domain-containing protein [Streptosporangiaceae bacterium]|nr:helix-turn-helix domain-containing protein [Streptosporangiaceae bacterium]